MTSRIQRNTARNGNGADMLQPDLLIEYLYYAVQDVRSISAQGARQLEDVIATLAAETRITTRPVGLRRRAT